MARNARLVSARTATNASARPSTTALAARPSTTLISTPEIARLVFLAARVALAQRLMSASTAMTTGDTTLTPCNAHPALSAPTTNFVSELAIRTTTTAARLALLATLANIRLLFAVDFKILCAQPALPAAPANTFPLNALGQVAPRTLSALLARRTALFAAVLALLSAPSVSRAPGVIALHAVCAAPAVRAPIALLPARLTPTPSAELARPALLASTKPLSALRSPTPSALHAVAAPMASTSPLNALAPRALSPLSALHAARVALASMFKRLAE